MSVLDHQATPQMQLWDGRGFKTVPQEEGEKLVAAGTHQDCRNVDGRELMTPAQFRAKRRKNQPKSEPKTREMKPKDTKFPYETKKAGKSS